MYRYHPPTILALSQTLQNGRQRKHIVEREMHNILLLKAQPQATHLDVLEMSTVLSCIKLGLTHRAIVLKNVSAQGLQPQLLTGQQKKTASKQTRVQSLRR